MAWGLLVPSVGVPQADSACAEGGVDGAGVDAVAVADPGEGLAVLVEPDGVVDLAGVQASAAHGHAVAVQVEGHGAAVDPEPFRQFIDRRSAAVLLGQQSDLGGGELPAGRPMATRGVRWGLSSDVV
jgi:hypothetical protein